MLNLTLKGALPSDVLERDIEYDRVVALVLCAVLFGTDTTANQMIVRILARLDYYKGGEYKAWGLPQSRDQT